MGNGKTIGDHQTDGGFQWRVEDTDSAVGEVRINDTTYGVIKWNGSEWLPDKKRGGLNAVFGFSNTDIWIAGGEVSHFDGIKWNPVSGYLNDTTGQYIVLDRVLNDNTPYTSIWGTSSNNLYLSGGRGKIIHWDGNKASIVFSTDLAILEIWGTDEQNIYAVAGDYSQHAGKLFHYEGGPWNLIRTGGGIFGSADTQGPFTSILGTKNDELFLHARYIESRYGGLWKKEVLCASWMYEITGTNSNNVASCGDYGIKHFNGIDWASFDGLTQRALYGIHVFDNKIFAVGDRIILIGTNY